MSDIKIFENKEFGEIRTVTINGETLFCGVDITRALGYKDSNKALKQHCREDGVAIRPVIDSMGRKQNAKFISEGNLYRLTSNSELPSAEKFDIWIFDEVLPSIRKTGSYNAKPSPIESATLRGIASVGCLIERTMKKQGSQPHEVPTVLDSLFKQSGIILPECFVKIPKYVQMNLSSFLFTEHNENGFLSKKGE